jgi:hypothetical protein
MRLVRPWVFAAALLGSITTARADNQTNDVSPIETGGDLPYTIDVQTFDFGSADLPTLHSFAAGEFDGKWVLISGRTNGLHGFGSSSPQNFPASSQNHDVWVIDPVTRQSWHRSLDTDSTLSSQMIAELTSTNTEFAQLSDRLYMVGGYGVRGTGSGFTTQNALTAIDLPGMVDWVMNGSGTASSRLRQVHDPMFQVTGGALYPLNGHMQLVFGQNFLSGYTPATEGAYNEQVRSFDIVDNGTTLSFNNLGSTPPLADYHRRDLNVFPTIARGGGGTLTNGLVALSGVFTTTNGAWTVPVQIDANGNPSMANPALAGTFKQAMNNYDSAKLGLFSENSNQMHEVLFGGISLTDYDRSTNTFIQDNNLPFINQISSVVIDQNGNYSQHLLGEFPQILDLAGNRLRFGANAQFFLAAGVPTYDNGVIELDQLTQQTVLGYIFGGLFANAPNTQGVAGAVSGASNQIFEVVYSPVPEPPTVALVLCGAGVWALRRMLFVKTDSLCRV